MAELAKGGQRQEVSATMGKKMMAGGVMSMQMTMMTIKGTSGAIAMTTAEAAGAGTISAVSTGGLAAYPGPMRFFIVGVVFSAQTGLDYRRLKKGTITKAEFKKRLRRGAFVSTGNLAGGTSGMVGGFVIGQMLIPLPVLGGIIGTIVGGVIGGIAGTKTAIKLYERQEE